MPISRSNIEELLIEDIHKHHGLGYEQYPKDYLKFFDEETSDGEVEKYQETIGLGLHQEKPEGVNASLDTIATGPTTYIENIAYALGYQVTHETLADNKYKKVINQALDMGHSAGETVETEVIDRLNTAFSTASADLLADGKAMCATDHPLYLGGGTGKNRPTTGSSLSEASLITDMNNIAAFTDPRGKKIMTKGKMLIVPQAKAVQAQKLLHTELQVGTAQNDINVFGRGPGWYLPGGYVVSQFITNDNHYFIRTGVRGLVFQKREFPARIMEDMVKRSMVREVISYMRFGVGCYDWRSIYGNPGS